ncbi:hypothetical protein GGI12_003135 [Dipsacomyces acuminosporus]|nr:hypothetical protein GGI12_003135 [Dipsacomyces acuminosporus]
MDIKFLKNLPNSTLGKLNIGYPVTDSMFGVIAWFSPSITELKIRNLTLTKFLKIIATPRARGYYVFDNLTKLLLDFNEPAFIEQFALNEFNCKQMFPKLEQLVVDSFTYNLPTLLQLFSGTTKLQNLALNNCNSSLLQVKLNFNNTLNGRMDQEHLRSFACTLDQSNMEDLNTNNIQTFLNQIFMTRSTSLENLNLNIRTVKPLNFPTSNISLVNLRSLTLTVPLKLCLFAKFLTLLPKLEAMDIILIDTGPVDDQQDCEEEGNLILGGGSALNATLEKLKVTFYNMTITDNIGYSLAYGMVLYIAKLPALRSLLALNMEESVLRKCIGWVLANEHILNNVGHLHALKWRGIQMS